MPQHGLPVRASDTASLDGESMTGLCCLFLSGACSLGQFMIACSQRMHLASRLEVLHSNHGEMVNHNLPHVPRPDSCAALFYYVPSISSKFCFFERFLHRRNLIQTQHPLIISMMRQLLEGGGDCNEGDLEMENCQDSGAHFD